MQFPWGVMSKYLFTPDRAWMADQRNNFIKVQLGQMILLRLLKRIGEVLLKIITRSTPRQLHHWKVYPRITPKSYSHRDACTTCRQLNSPEDPFHVSWQVGEFLLPLGVYCFHNLIVGNLLVNFVSFRNFLRLVSCLFSKSCGSSPTTLSGGMFQYDRNFYRTDVWLSSSLYRATQLCVWFACVCVYMSCVVTDMHLPNTHVKVRG